MSGPLPERYQRYVAADGQRAREVDENASRFLADVEGAMVAPMSFRDERPVPQYGTAPPVAQPGTPPMSQRAVDVSRTVMTCSLATVPPGLIGVAAMLASGYADPWVVGMVCAAPAALAIPVLALARLIRGAKEAAPPEVHHHYAGPVHQEQRHTHTSTRGVWARTNNQQ